MELRVIALAAIFSGISALPVEQYSGGNPQPFYWVGGPSPASYDGPLTPLVYRNNPTIGSPPPHPPAAKAGEPFTPGYPLLSPPSAGTILQPGSSWITTDVPASSRLALPTGTSHLSAPTELKVQNSFPLTAKIPQAPFNTPLEYDKENSKVGRPFMPKVTIFAPGSLIKSDLIHSFLGKASEESDNSVFIYAPGSIFVSQDEATSAKSSVLGLDNLVSESLTTSSGKLGSVSTLIPGSLLNAKGLEETPSEKPKTNDKAKRQGRLKKKENTEDDDEGDSDND